MKKTEQQQEPQLHEEGTPQKYWHKYEYKKGNGFGVSFILILLGTLFLLNNFDLLPWSVWTDIWRFWPLLLIFWGFQMIFGKSKIANILLLIVALIVLGYFVLNTIANTNPQFNEYLKQNFPIWQNIYHYNPPVTSNDSRENRRRILNFEDPEDNEYDLP